MQYDEVPRMKDYYLYEYQDGTQGPVVLPGKYQVKLTVDGQSQTAPLTVRMDPRVTTPAADLKAQFDLLMDIRQELTKLYSAYTQIGDVRAQLKGMRERLPQTVAYKPVFSANGDLDAKLAAIQDEMIEGRNHSNEDSLSFGVKLDGQLSGLAMYVTGESDSAPTAAAVARYEVLRGQLEAALTKWKTVVETDLPGFHKLTRDQNIEAIIVPVAMGGEQAAEAK
jgi:hypothetical protein